MPRRILIAPDKFKGSLNAQEAAEAIARGILASEPDAILDLCPMADGGEGFIEAMASAMTGDWVHCRAKDALGRPINSRYFLTKSPQGVAAVMEMAETSGIWRIRSDELDPLRSTTLGVGMQMADAIQNHHVKQIFLGLGGSATNDGGCGMAEALGFRFLDTQGQAFSPTPENLSRLSRIESAQALHCPPVIAACDVSNPLLGTQGATTIFGPQKGAKTGDLTLLEDALTHLVDTTSAASAASTPGAGAAGGLGFGLLHFAKANLIPGFHLVAKLLDLDTRIQGADWIITGEGSLDAQSLGGKGPVGLARRAARFNKPITAFCGMVDGAMREARLFTQIRALADTGLPNDDLIRDASRLLENLARESTGHE